MRDGGAALAWGNNGAGQLGDGGGRALPNLGNRGRCYLE
ncbi:hypothetical protein [Streptomyces sp. NPDC001226]